MKHERSAEEPNFVIVRGAREHNLHIDELSIPKRQLVVFTGVSGSVEARARRREARAAAPRARGSVNFSLLAEVRETAVAELQARRGGFIHRPVDGLVTRATVRGVRGGGGSLDGGGTGRTGAFRFQGPEMSERYGGKATRKLAIGDNYRPATFN